MKYDIRPTTNRLLELLLILMYIYTFDTQFTIISGNV